MTNKASFSACNPEQSGFLFCIQLDIYAHSVYNEIMTVREIENKLFSDGWFVVKQIGSHRQYKHPTKKGKVTVPIHKGDLDIGTAKYIFKQAGIK